MQPGEDENEEGKTQVCIFHKLSDQERREGTCGALNVVIMLEITIMFLTSDGSQSRSISVHNPSQ
jgi:hypothetical protein